MCRACPAYLARRDAYVTQLAIASQFCRQDALTAPDLSHLDQFHKGITAFTARKASTAGRTKRATDL